MQAFLASIAARAAERAVVAVQGFENGQFLLFTLIHHKPPFPAKLPINKIYASFLINLLPRGGLWDIKPFYLSAESCRSIGIKLPLRLTNKKEKL